MSLYGNVDTMPLTDLFQWLVLSNKTGILIVERTPIVKEVYFQAGKIVSSASNDPREYFGQFLISHGVLNEKQLNEAFEVQTEENIQLGRVLVEQGLMTEKEIQRFLRMKAEETIYDLFLWDKANFKFFNDNPTQKNHVPIKVDATSLLMEGTRRADEWKRIRRVFPGNDTTVQIQTTKLNRELLQDPVYSRIIQAAEEPAKIVDLCYHFHGSDFMINKSLFDLYNAGVVEVVSREEPKEASEDTQEIIKSLMVEGVRLIGENRYEDALGTFKKVLEFDPANAIALGQIQKAQDALRAELVTKEFSLDRVPMLRVAPAEMENLPLAPQENYILSRVDGHSPIMSIIRISPIAEIEALNIFKRLAKLGHIDLVSPEDALEHPAPSNHD